MCVGFIDLNNARLKVIFALPWISLFMDCTARHNLLSLMDAFSKYNHILMYVDIVSGMV